MDFTGQTAVVTGAGGNLGSAIAVRLSAAGAHLVLADQRREPLEAIAAALPEGARVTLVDGADVREAAGCAQIVAAALAASGRIDALLNTVGGFRTRPIAEDAAADWAFLMELNALTALRLSQAVLAPMRAQRYGRIVHTAAGAGLKSFAGGAIYSASKAAVIRITESLAEENAEFSVTANCVLPGTIDTPQNRAAMPSADVSTWVTPATLAETFVFLASRGSAAITGAGIPAFGRG